MESKQKIDPIDEALKLWILSENTESTATVNASEHLKYITETKYQSEISETHSKQMIDMLYNNLAVDSLGILLETAITKSSINIDRIAAKVNLPQESIEQLKLDQIFANSIPVISLRDLLKELQIPFEQAKQAILKSFSILKNNIDFTASSINNIRLTYRRKNANSVSLNTKVGKSDSQYLFENEEALTKYITRLGELY